MYLIIRISIWVLDVYKQRLLELSLWASFSFALYIVARLLCSYLCLFDTIMVLKQSTTLPKKFTNTMQHNAI